MNNKKKKIIYLIGGAGLIGKAILLRLVNKNYKILVIDKNRPSISNKNKYDFEKINFEQISKIENKFQFFFKKYGIPDHTINCSYPKAKDFKNLNFEKYNLSSLRKNIDIHLNSFLHTSVIILNKMKKYKKRGSLVLFSSIYGIVAQNSKVYKGTKIRENFVYSSIKAAIINFAKQACAFYGKDEIRVNAISPGGVIDKYNKNDKNFIRNYKNQNPTKKLASPDEIALSTIFLISDNASYVNGVNLIVDGGWTSI